MKFEIRTANDSERKYVLGHIFTFPEEGTAGQIGTESVEREGVAKKIEGPIGNADILVAAKNGNLIGYIVYTSDDENFYTDRKQGFICELYVEPFFRGNGIARALVGGCEENLKSKGIDELFLNVFATDSAAISLYEKSGFENFNAQ